MEEDVEAAIPEEISEERQTVSRNIVFWGIITAITVAAALGIWHLNREQVLDSRELRFVIRIYERNQPSKT